jgi:aerobic carbon-monoxide dehydrogenase small subunit
MRVALTVNGKAVAAEVAPRTHLADFLREQLLLTGTHIGCEHGICGACTVEIDGEIARSCITYAVACDGAEVRTIEGFDDDPMMTQLRQAFTEAHALQCGYCTPGMLIAARDLIRRKRGLSRPEIRTEMSGNLCRCTGYQGIVDAIERVMAEPAIASVERPTRSWLGPAPGPRASSASTSVIQEPAAPTPRQSSPRSISAPGRRGKREPIVVEVSGIEEVEGATRLSQRFTLAHPREKVWALMSDVEAVARCMPGLSLDGPPEGDRVSGRLEVKIGPITASFAGQGTLTQIAPEYRQVISGSGGDRKSGSRATGSIDYRLAAVDGDAATRVDVAISYVLTGPLAQIGRSGIVRDLVRRIGEVFAQNVEAELTEPGGQREAAQLGGLTLVLQLLADRVRVALSRLLGRRG